MTESRTVTLDSRDEAVPLFGPRDAHLRMIRDALAVRIIARGDTLQIDGDADAVSKAERAFEQLRQVLKTQDQLQPEDVRTVLAVVQTGGERGGAGTVGVTDGGKYLRARTDGQGRYIQAMRDNDVILCVGPAGTGKTYLAVAMAVTMLRQNAIKRVVLVRPAVEAGERLGYLPGDLSAKINPYLRPLFDSLNDMMEPEQVKRYLENDVIEIAPLAYMRGRAQPVTSRVLTPDGFRPIGTIHVGDFVVGSDGRPTRVLGVFPQGRKEVFRVTMTDGATTRCCGEHLWSVTTRDDTRRGKPSRVLQTSDMIGQLRANHYHRYELPLLSEPVAWQSRGVPIDPYALGLLLGDGCITGSTTPSFATTDRELVESLDSRLVGIGATHKGGVDYVLNAKPHRRGSMPNPLTVRLRELDLLGTRSSTKFVPRDYLLNGPDIRHAVLQGLLDTDGGPVTQVGRTCRVQYVSTSRQLCDDVVFLVRSLGGVATQRIRRAEGRTPGCAMGRPVPYRSDAYCVDLRLPHGIAPFRLRRKAERYAAHGSGRPMRYIHAIEPDGADECVCIQVAAADSLYVTDDFILTHNTLNQAVIILDEGQNTTVPQMKMFLTRMGHGSKIIVTGDITQVDLPRTTRSGLSDAVHRLRKIDKIGLVFLGEGDIVRHPLVQRIVRAYEDDGPRKRP